MPPHPSGPQALPVQFGTQASGPASPPPAWPKLNHTVAIPSPARFTFGWRSIWKLLASPGRIVTSLASLNQLGPSAAPVWAQERGYAEVTIMAPPIGS